MRALLLPWTVLALGSAAIASSAPVQGDQQPLDLALEQARREAAEAQALQQRTERAAGEARNEAQRLRLEQVAAAQAIAAEEARISSADAETRLLRTRLAAERQRLARERAPVSALLAGLVIAGRRPPLTLLAGADSRRELIKVKLLVGAVAPHIAAKSAGVAARLEASRALEQAALAARSEAVASRSRLEQRKTRLAKLETEAIALAERRGGQALGAGDAAIASDEQLALVERQSASGRRASALGSELASLGPAPAAPFAKGLERPPIRYRLPVAAPVTEGLGNVSDSGIRSRGVTFATRRGAPVAAPANGTILFAGPFRDYDGIVIIDHGGGWRSVLVNVGSVAARGARVGMGQRLGSALGPVEIQLQHRGKPVSAAIIAGSSALLSKAGEPG